jgi:GcrA cell cycle regulator
MRTQPKNKPPEDRQREKWSSERLALLERLWRDGETASVIAQTLGVSRSAVIGRIFRLRLSAAGSKTTVASPKTRRRGRIQPPPPPPRKRGKSLLELTNGDCRWPIGNPGGTKFHFCGEPGADVEQGIPYCRLHMQRAYLPAPKPLKVGNAIGGWHAISPGITAAVRRMFREAIARRERT